MRGYEAADSRLGIVGAGKIGTAVARAAVASGYDVAISGSGAAERIELIVDVLAPGAHAVTTDDVVRHADLIVLAVPMHRFRELPPDLFAGKILVDAMNYWEEVDGIGEELATAPTGTSVVVQQRFSTSQWSRASTTSATSSLRKGGVRGARQDASPSLPRAMTPSRLPRSCTSSIGSASTLLMPARSLPASPCSQAGRCSASLTATTDCRISSGPRPSPRSREACAAHRPTTIAEGGHEETNLPG